MKKGLILMMSMLMPLMSHGGVLIETPKIDPSQLSIPVNYKTSSQTATLEWGCPVAEVVQARSRTEALQKIKSECMEEVQRAAQSKPGVFDVIHTSVIWPDISVSEEREGFYLKGTFFFETVVLQQANNLVKKASD